MVKAKIKSKCTSLHRRASETSTFVCRLPCFNVLPSHSLLVFVIISSFSLCFLVLDKIFSLLSRGKIHEKKRLYLDMI